MHPSTTVALRRGRSALRSNAALLQGSAHNGMSKQIRLANCH
ncbi:MAG: hypothetical protein ABI700_31885 [Chloroflexota bacterium]